MSRSPSAWLSTDAMTSQSESEAEVAVSCAIRVHS
jgi:hypothetical protein